MAMKRDPQRVLSEAEKPPSLPEPHMTFLKRVLGDRPGTGKSGPDDRSIP
jgi:hypothetical protein